MTGVSAVLDGATCLLFDYGGTLDADGVDWKEQFRALYETEGLVIAPAAFDRAFYDADDPLIGTVPADAGLADTVGMLVANLEERLGADRGRERRIVDRFLATTKAALARNRPILEALSERHWLGLVSNWYGNLAAVCRELKLDTLFDAIADSERVGVTKPDPDLLRAGMNPHRADPGTTVMIGDSLHRDGEGARRLGCGFIWLAPADLPDNPEEGCRIATLADLQAVAA